MSTEPLLPKPPLVHSASDTVENGNSFDFEAKNGGFLLPQLSVELKKERLAAWQRTWVVQWGRRKVVDPFVCILSRGLEPKLLSLSAALGLTFGIFPVCGVTLVLCAIAAAILQSNCHVPTLMLGNFVVSPFELGLVVPFMRVGELVTGGEHFLMPSSSGLWEAIRGCKPRALMFGMLHAIIGWSVVAPLLVAFLYICFLPIFGYLVSKFGADSYVQHPLPPVDNSCVPEESAPPTLEVV